MTAQSKNMPQPRNHNGDVSDLLCTSVLAITYLVLFGATFNYYGYVTDEIYTLRAIDSPFADLIRERASHGHPPLFFIIEKLWVSVVGRTEIGYRSVPLLCGFGSLLTVFAQVRRE